MSLPAVAKIGVGSTLAIGAPTSIYLTWDHINYYEAERKVIYGTEDLSEADIPSGSGTVSNGETNIKKFHSSDNKWSCSIRATAGSGSIDETNKTSLASYIKGKINSSDPNTKQSSRKTLVHNCSRNRKMNNDVINAELTISVRKDNSRLKVSLFSEGKEEEATSTGGS